MRLGGKPEPQAGDLQNDKTHSSLFRAEGPRIFHALFLVCTCLAPVFYIFKRSWSNGLPVWMFGFFLLYHFAKGRLPRFKSPLAFPLLIFLAIVEVTSLYTIGPADTWREGKPLLYGVVVFFMLVEMLPSAGGTRNLCGVIVLVLAILVSVDAIYQWFHGVDIMGRRIYGETRVTALFSNPNFLSLFLVGTFPFFLDSRMNRASMVGRLFTVVSVSVLVTAVLMAQTRSAWFAVLLIVVLAVWKYPRKYWISPLIGVVLSIFVDRACDGMFWSRLVNSLRQDEARWMIWSRTWDTIQKHSLVGIGLDQFKELIKVSDQAFAHNFFLDIWLSSGVFALAGFLVFIGYLFVEVWRGLRGGDESFLWGLAVLGVFLSAVINVSFFTRYFSNYFWWMLGLFVSSLNGRKAAGLLGVKEEGPSHGARR